MKDFAFIGAEIPRVEDQKLLTGKAQFVDNIHLDGMLYAAIVRSGVAHGRILSIDTSYAKEMPGVRAIYTAAEIAEKLGDVPRLPIRLSPIKEHEPFLQWAAATEKVRYVGEPIAIVIADSVYEAEDAAENVFVDIEPLPAITNTADSLSNETLLFEKEETNIPVNYVAQKGDALNTDGPYVRKERFSTQRHSAVTMETRGLVATWDSKKEHMTVYGAAKVPFRTREFLATSLQLPKDSVDMIEVAVGGGFGVRGEYYPEDFLVPFSSYCLGRPIKWIEDRLENLMGSNHSRQMDCELEIVCERNGKILALRGVVYTDNGAYMRSSGAVPTRNVAQFLSGPYDIEHIHIEAIPCLTNKGPIGTYRGPGRFEADFFRERLLDIAAEELGIDQIEFRRMNLVRSEQMPYPLATLNKPDKPEDLDSGLYELALDQCLEGFEWDKKKHLQGQLVDGVYHGLAVTCFIEGGGGGVSECAKLVLEEDRTLSIYVGSTNIGQGVVTILTQIAAETLKIPMEKIRIFHGSTIYLEQGYGSFHSRSTALGGSAVYLGCLDLLEKIKEYAAAQFSCSTDDIEIGANLQTRHGDRVLDIEKLAAVGFSVESKFSSYNHTYAYGTAAAHVTVDPETGEVKLLNYYGIEDIGRVINPLTASGQSVGGIVQGLGGVFLEEFAYDDQGQFISGTLADYAMPTASDFPSIKAIETGNAPTPHNPLGAKGCGEGGIVPVGGVVANAVAAALRGFGAEPNHLPLTAPRVWELIHSKEKAEV